MTERQERILARFLASAVVASLVADSVTLRLTLAGEKAMEALAMRNYEIPVGDSVYAYMSQYGRQAIWEAASLLGLALALAFALCAFGGRVARTVLAAAAVALMVHGPMATVRIVDAFASATGLGTLVAPAVKPSVDGGAPSLATALLDGGEVVWLLVACMRAAVIVASVVLVANLWRARGRAATA